MKLLDWKDQPLWRISLTALGMGAFGKTDFQYASGDRAAWLATKASWNIILKFPFYYQNKINKLALQK